MLRTVAILNVRIHPIPVCETTGNGIRVRAAAAAIVPDIDNHPFQIFEFLNHLIDGLCPIPLPRKTLYIHVSHRPKSAVMNIPSARYLVVK